MVQSTSARTVTAADAVTCSRFVLAAAVGAVALTSGPRWLVGTLAGVALVTDFADGRIARGTGTESRLGARLDQEADAVLILVLSAVVATRLGPWVLALGAARYVFGALFAAVPALRTPPAAPRSWCKVVAATVGIVLAVAAGIPLPHPAAAAAVAVSGALLAESFVHEAVDRWRAPRQPVAVPYPTLLAVAAVWLALVAPTNRDQLTGQILLRLPVEVLLLVALALLPWSRVRTGLAAALGVLLAALVLVKLLDVSFQAVLDRNFDPVGDWSLLGPGLGVLGDSIGSGWARVVAVLACLAVAAALVGIGLATVRLVRVAARRRRPTLTTAAVFGTVWVLALATGAQAAQGAPVASANAFALTVDEVRTVTSGIADGKAFSHQIRSDPFGEQALADTDTLLAGLAGKDVLLVFVESYGRVAVQGTSFSPGVDRVLDEGTRQLDAAGYRSRSAFLTSPTFGGVSWLAHSTLESGLWVDSQRRYDQLLGSRRLTLTSLFGHAGWRTVFDVPADTRTWSQGQRFYGFDQYYDANNVGYAGPKFGYAPIPDQYTLDQLRRRELTPGPRRPVMAEIDLVSSHAPWTPLPSMVPWSSLGDGSVYDGMPEKGPTSAQVYADNTTVKAMYGRSVQYTWQALTSFLTTYDDPNLVVIALGDHQPHTYVSGTHPGHDVPITVIAKDPAVMKRISGWGWQPGLHPAPDASVWRMDTFRDRFLAAFNG